MRSKNHAISVGLTLGLVLLAPSAIHAQPLGFGTARPAEEKKSGALATSNSRFVFGQVTESSKDLFMLDTITGRLWRIAESGKLGTYLKPVLYCPEDGECTAVPPAGSKLDSQSKGR